MREEQLCYIEELLNKALRQVPSEHICYFRFGVDILTKSLYEASIINSNECARIEEAIRR